MFTKLSIEQIKDKIKFITDYIKAPNAATGSAMDANANVSCKNIVTMQSELYKDFSIQVRRQIMHDKITELFDKETADSYIEDIENHVVYQNDETGLLMPYTYSAKESVVVIYKGKKLLLSLDQLYEKCDEFEQLLDEDKEVYAKYPEDLYVIDREGETKITRLVKKKRHRDLVRVKTAFGEDIVVTDNHPMIISDNKDNTIDAIDSINQQQFRLNNKVSFDGQTSIDMATLSPFSSDIYEDFYISQESRNSTIFAYKRYVELNEEFGYFVGFFIGDGNFNYNKDENKNHPYICITQKNVETLKTLAAIIYKYTGCTPIIEYKNDKTNCWYLKVKSADLVFLLNSVFGIEHFAQNKCLPLNIFDYNEDFAKGIIEGIIDSDGTVENNRAVSIRLSSRTCITQLAILLKYFGLTPGISTQSSKFGCNELVHANYTIWGIRFSITDKTSKFNYSYKCKHLDIVTKGLKYSDGWSNITNVDLVEKSSFLDQNEYIYDITTESNTFMCNNLWVHNCTSITMYPFLTDGLTKLGGESKKPEHLESYCGGFVNLVFAVASQFSGAVSTPEFLTYFNYFCEKDYGENYLEDNEETVKNHLQHCVYALNQPAAARNFQSVFWNIAIFDEYYFNSLFEDFVFPDGVRPNWNNVKKLQQYFMTWFNEERTKALLTFPVVTCNTLIENEMPKDTEMLDFMSKEMSEGNSFFIYQSDSIDSLSSCCFSKDQKVLCKSSNGGLFYDTFEELSKIRTADRKNFTIFHNGSWNQGKLIKVPSRKMYKITTVNNKEIIVSDNHLNPTLDGDKYTDQLTTDDYLLFNCNKLDTYPEADQKLTYEQGFAIGAFLGDGSFGTRFKDDEGNEFIYDTNFSLNKDCYSEICENVNKALQQLGEDKKVCINSIQNNVYPCRVSSKSLVRFIQYWTNWEEGTYHFNKKLNLDCLLQSYEFRKGILDGWYATDGGNSNRCYTTSKLLAEHMEVLITSLGMHSIIDISDRTNEKVIIRGEEYNRNYPLLCVRWYDPKNKRNMTDVFKYRNNSMYFKIRTIEEIEYNDDKIYCFEMKSEDEPYFTLPNGIITHNCRLRNELTENVFSYTLGAGGIATGSINVITINLNRVVQKNIDLEKLLDRIYKYHYTYRVLLQELQEARMLPVYDAGFISLKKQFSTIGVNGMVEAAEFKNIEISDNEEYKNFVNSLLEVIYTKNKEASKKYKCLFNTEFVPGESLGVKNAKWDKKDGLKVNRECYNSYFYKVEDNKTNVVTKFILHGKEFIKYLDGGSALHLNLEEYPTKEGFRKLLITSAKTGCNYFTTNVKISICNECGHIDKRTLNRCPKCGSRDLDYATRIIGYLKRISSFSKDRQYESDRRFYN